MKDGPSRMLVWVTAHGRHGPEGTVLSAEGQFRDETMSSGSALEDHEFEASADPSLTGLLVFEGWVEVGRGEDPDVKLCGWLRRVETWELCRLRFGEDIFGSERGSR